ncbi:adenylate/guanylate cyclase domain-containing protein [Anaeromyxobacter oryzae]|uniref:Adenylate cyclase n=1 Tax=Anaeromyxobacter oryzae TaxID=2918170 RepID=A0ABM7WPK1_9BACT|nr:adenylate/guanylate cyclase domain-containing protein [Anaeromyxobacter oryzae]BDG01392.1 adenylate cyclase [Anaeromyxobacter oryzae]
MPDLFVSNGARAGTVFFLEHDPTIVGRAETCDAAIPDSWISSRHCRFERRGAEWWIVDLGSRNGTYLDGRRISEAPVRDGSRVCLGQTEAVIRNAAQEGRARGGVPRNATAVRFLADVAREIGGKAATAAAGSARRQVAVLNAIGRALVEASSLEDSLSHLLRAVASEARAERSTLLLMDETGAMVPRAHEPPGAPPRLSTTIVSAAVRARAGLLVLDAQQDERFATSQSVVFAGIRSCACVPIWAENRILGALVLDRAVVEPFTADDLELVTVAAYQAALAIERARNLERARAADLQRSKLLRHFSPAVAEAILAHEGQEDDPLGSSVREEVTVLFSDIRGFTELTERLPVPELTELLRAYFREMTRAVFAERGTLDKFIGDGLMAIFGAPVPDPEGADHAVRCACRMLERLADLNTRLSPDRRLAIRIGVNTGRVAAGTFGSPERMEYTVLGDTVNVASRLESIAEPGTVYVGPTTFERTRGSFGYCALGARALRGRASPVEVYRLEWSPDAAR